MSISQSETDASANDQILRLNTLGRALCHATTGEQATSVILKEGLIAAGAQTGYLALLNTERTEFATILYREAKAADDPVLLPLSVGTGLAAEALSQGEALFTALQQSPFSSYPHLADAGDQAAALVLNADEQALGVLELHWPQTHSFSQNEQVFLQTIAHLCALALARTCFYEAIQQEATVARRAEAAIQQMNAELELSIAVRTAELQASVEELEAFSYSVSHDLRAPLRAIDGFSRILLEDFAPSLPETAQRHLNRVRANARNMGNLIDDLLAFSRLNRQALDRQNVAPATLVQEALETLSSDQQGRDIRLLIEDLPCCSADATLLRQVFINLLSNALKFTRGCDPAILEVGSQQKEGECLYFIRDNGVGFDMKFYDKLFGVFQRLHRAEDYEGTGVGLALVQRIIRRHGGRLWAEGVPQQGATFYFTLGQGETHAE